MRRPLKPFVTEYKGARRPTSNQPQTLEPPREGNPTGPGQKVSGPWGSGQSSGAAPRTPWPSDSWPGEDGGNWSGNAGAKPTAKSGAMANDRSRPRPVDINAGPDADDAYEAAMRAADALFTRPAPAQPSQPAGSPFAASPTSPETQTGPAGSAAPERGGRILQAIDETPAPQYAALEAAYAPKRRGRKPGSKNKPKENKPKENKPKENEFELKPETDLSASPPRELYAPVPQAVEFDDDDEAVLIDDAPAPTTAAPAIQTLEALSTGNAPRGLRRAGRVSERAKPGEGWKRRRLPRVCW